MELVILKALLIIIPIGMAVVILWYAFYVGSYVYKSKHLHSKKR